MIYFVAFQAGCRLRKLSILTVLALTLYNVLITVRLMHGPVCLGPQETRTEPPHTTPPPAPHCPQNLTGFYAASFARLDLRFGRWDAKRMLKMFDNAIVGDRYAELSDKYSVCLATQSSLEKLFSLVQVSMFVDHFNTLTCFQIPITCSHLVLAQTRINNLFFYATIFNLTEQQRRKLGGLG